MKCLDCILFNKASILRGKEIITISHNFRLVATKFHKLSQGNRIGFRRLVVGGVVDFLGRTVRQLVVEGKEAEGPVDGEGNAGKGEDG